MTKLQRKRLFRDKSGKVVLVQAPNTSITVWALTWLTYMLMPIDGAGRAVIVTASMLALIVWALNELFRGVNYFRQILGLVVLLGIVQVVFTR